MNESDAKAEFFAEVSAWGDLLAARRTGTSEGGMQPAPADPAADWHRAAQLLRGGRLFFGYPYLFMAIGVLLIILALIGAVLMAQKVASGGRVL